MKPYVIAPNLRWAQEHVREQWPYYGPRDWRYVRDYRDLRGVTPAVIHVVGDPRDQSLLVDARHLAVLSGCAIKYF